MKVALANTDKDLLEKQYQVFKKIEYKWFYQYMFVDVAYLQRIVHPETYEMSKNDLFKQSMNCIAKAIASNEPEKIESRLYLPAIVELDEMFNLPEDIAASFITRFYSELYLTIGNMTYYEAKDFINNLTNEI